ncbi:MAG TPA: histidine phosphatase family protein [Acidimicrobiales bacterium]|nr:histidine phosphatase family protein [Acidimicrobiales bacterium]
MARLLLLRHGQSVWNAEGRWQGSADPPLSADGAAQAALAAEQLEAEQLWAVWSSPLSRARQTAEIISARLGLGAVLLEPGLRERDVGQLSGLTTPEIEERWPGLLAEWRTGTLETLPGGEGDIRERVVGAVQRIAVASDEAGHETVLVLTHGGSLTSVEVHIGAEPSRPRNLCGRWVHWDGASLRAAEVVQFLDPGEPSVTTVL